MAVAGAIRLHLAQDGATRVTRVALPCLDAGSGQTSPVLATLASDGDKPRWEWTATWLPAASALQPPWLHDAVPVPLPSGVTGVIQANVCTVRLAWPTQTGDWTWRDVVEVDARMDGLYSGLFATAGNQTWDVVTAGELSWNLDTPVGGLRLDLLSLNP
jgi:hypothetical protein